MSKRTGERAIRRAYRAQAPDGRLPWTAALAAALAASQPRMRRTAPGSRTLRRRRS